MFLCTLGARRSAAQSLMSLDKVNYEFSIEGAPEGLWAVRAVLVDEPISQPYTLTVDLKPPADVRLAEILGASCTLTMRRGDTTWNRRGIICRYEALHGIEPGGRVRVVAAPAFLALESHRDCRIFEEMTVPEILKHVLQERLLPYDRRCELVLLRDYVKREYCVQHAENDMNFVHRLMQDEGIGYFFDHTATAEKMVLVDDNRTFPNYGGAQIIELAMAYSQPTALESVTHFTVAQQASSTKIVVNQFDWSRPRDALGHAAGGADARGREREVFLAGGSRLMSFAGSSYTQDNTQWRAQTTLDVELLRRWEGTGGNSGAPSLAPGAVFKLRGHAEEAYDEDYLVTHVTHRGEGEVAPADTTQAYSNTFWCIPLRVTYRPTYAIKSGYIPGLQTATVVGPAGEEVWTDAHGRIKVRFHWDRGGKDDANGCCWVRVSQTWAGPTFGSVFLPRIGMEVLVGFIEGCPDQPIVLGCTFNGGNLAPYDPQESKTKTVLRTSSSPGGAGYNELSFEDAQGAEEVYLRAQRNMRAEVLNNVTTQIAGTERHAVAGTRTASVGHDDTLNVQGNSTTDVGGDRAAQVEGNDHETILKDQHATVEGALFTAVGKDATLTVGGKQNVAIDKDLQVDVAATHRLLVGENLQIQVRGDSAHQVSKALAVQADTLELRATTRCTITQGDAAVTLKGGNVIIRAKTIKLNGEDIVIDASGKLKTAGSTTSIN